MIKKVILSLVTIAGFPAAALAADLPQTQAPPQFSPPAAALDARWAGVSRRPNWRCIRPEYSLTTIPPFPGIGFPGVAVPAATSPSGIIGGAHIGYNIATSPWLGIAGIVGLEGDVDGSKYQRIVTFGPGNPFGVGAGSTETIKSGIQGSIRARAGVVVVDQALLYATGGVAFSQFSTSYNNVGTGFDSFSHVLTGYVVGAGAEYAVTRNWSIRLEYLYSQFPSFYDHTTHASALPNTVVSQREIEQRVQVGASYKF